MENLDTNENTEGLDQGQTEEVRAEGGVVQSEEVPSPSVGAEGGAEEVKVMAALAYIGILFFLPLVTHPKNEFGRFHANQGLVLLIAGIVGSTVLGIIPIIGWMLLPLFNLGIFVLAVLGFINAFNLKTKRLPLVGSFDLIK